MKHSIEIFRKLLAMALAVAALSAASCAKEETPDAQSSCVKVFSASMEPSSNLKTSLDGLSVNWSETDKIAVFTPDGTKACFSVDPASIDKTKHSAKFTGTIKYASEYYAVYPYSEEACLSSGVFSLVAPATQTAVQGGFGQNANIAVAHSSDGGFAFKNVCTLLKLTVKADNASKIEFSADGVSLSGAFNVNADNLSVSVTSGSPTVSAAAAEGNLPIGVYYVPVPWSANAIGNISISVKSSTDQTLYTRNVSSTSTLCRNMICNTGELGPKGIASAADLVAFATAVNGGKSIAEWQQDGIVQLLCDIDCSNIETWTPIGYASVDMPATAADVLSVKSGKAFTAKFDGNGFKLKGLKMTAPADGVAGKPYGLFGTLTQGAVVQNFQFDENCSLTVNSTATNACGLIAGLNIAASVRDVTSFAKIDFYPNAGAAVFGGLVGLMNSTSTTAGLIDSCHSYGTVTTKNVDNYTKNGWGCYVYGGILGAVTGPMTSSVTHNVSDCSMNGTFTSDMYRSAGIVGAELSSCMIANCFNNAACTITTNSTGLFGGITSVMGSYTNISGCMNKGSLTCTNSCRIGAIVCLVTAGGRTIYGSSNYGVILSDSANRGVFYGYKQSTPKTIYYENCTAAGKIGTYNGGNPVYDSYTSANKTKYLGNTSGTDVVDLKNITYKIGTLEPEDPTADLKLLFLGNSFTQDAVYHLPGILAGGKIKTIKMVHMYYGGRTLIQYNSGWSTSNDYHKYVCAAGSTSWVDNTGANLEKVVSSEEWDVVTIQEHTGTYYSWLPSKLQEETTAIQELCAKIKAAQKGSPKIYFIMSQAYYDFSKSKFIEPYGGFFDPYDHTGMFKAIAEQGENFTSLTCLTDIISTGGALENLRTSSLAKGHKLCLSRDGYHMDYGVSRYAAACLVYNVAIYPLTKISLENNTFRYSNSSTTTGSYSTPVTDSNYKLCQKAAELAQSEPFKITDMSAY